MHGYRKWQTAKPCRANSRRTTVLPLRCQMTGQSDVWMTGMALRRMQLDVTTNDSTRPTQRLQTSISHVITSLPLPHRQTDVLDWWKLQQMTACSDIRLYSLNWTLLNSMKIRQQTVSKILLLYGNIFLPTRFYNWFCGKPANFYSVPKACMASTSSWALAANSHIFSHPFSFPLHFFSLSFRVLLWSGIFFPQIYNNPGHRYFEIGADDKRQFYLRILASHAVQSQFRWRGRTTLPPYVKRLWSMLWLRRR